jgi:hypothetical protein
MVWAWLSIETSSHFELWRFVIRTCLHGGVHRDNLARLRTDISSFFLFSSGIVSPWRRSRYTAFPHAAFRIQKIGGYYDMAFYGWMEIPQLHVDEAQI